MPEQRGEHRHGAAGHTANEAARRRLRAALDGELVPEQTEDESGRGWGEPPASDEADLQRFRDEKPPHHL